jgi:hypothetical protein
MLFFALLFAPIAEASRPSIIGAMKIESHLEKFRRFDTTLSRLDPVHDPELWIWTAMNGCTHLLNAALHHCGATKETDSFHTQAMGLYAVPQRHAGMTDSLHAPGDVMHVGQPPLAAVLSPALEDACAALRVLEDLREPHVRGSDPIPPGDERRWGEAYRRCVAQLGAALSLPPTQ